MNLNLTNNKTRNSIFAALIGVSLLVMGLNFLPRLDFFTASKTANLAEQIATNTKGRVKVDSIRKTPVDGIYEVVSGGDVFYSDSSGRYAFSNGGLIDMQAQKDLTGSRIDDLQRVDFADLPLQYAIKEVHGDGSRSFAVFEDPNCPICRVFTKFVSQIDNATVYRFMYPVISQASAATTRRAYCSEDKAKAWEQAMAGAPVAGPENCDTSGIEAILKIGEKYKITNTPTVILSSGKRLVGATPPDQFVAEINALNK